VHYHFRDKEELLFSAVKDRIGGFEKQVLEAVTVAGDAQRGPPRVLDACLVHATVSNHPRLIITVIIQGLDTNPRPPAEIQRIPRRMRAFLAELGRRGQGQGSMRSDIAPEMAAALIAGAIIGAEVQHYQDPTEIDLRATLDTTLEALATWLASGGATQGIVASGGANTW